MMKRNTGSDRDELTKVIAETHILVPQARWLELCAKEYLADAYVESLKDQQ
jgi:hypothetical protein